MQCISSELSTFSRKIIPAFRAVKPLFSDVELSHMCFIYDANKETILFSLGFRCSTDVN